MGRIGRGRNLVGAEDRNRPDPALERLSVLDIHTDGVFPVICLNLPVWVMCSPSMSPTMLIGTP